jgi:HTH-type transcriptional regulator/antitoxin HigA
MVKEARPFMNIAPGEFIREELEIRNWQQDDLAEVVGLSKKFVNELIMNKKHITIETARLLSKAFGQSPAYWINLDINYYLRKSPGTRRTKEVEEKAKIFKYMPIKEMVKKGWLKPYKTLEALKRQVLAFWNINELDFIFLEKTEVPGFRKPDIGFNYNKYYALCWFEMAKKMAKNFHINNYEKKKLKELVEKLPIFMINENGVEEFISELAAAGIKFFVLSHLKKAFIDGAVFYDDENPVIVYTSRYDRIDNFWFTMAHEISHILLHLNKKGVAPPTHSRSARCSTFEDGISKVCRKNKVSQGISKKSYFLDNLEHLESEFQQEAQNLAVKILKVEEIMEYFKTRKYQKYISAPRVIYCKEELKLDSTIIAGVLQHYGKMSKKNLNRFKKTVSNLIPKKYFAEKMLKVPVK